MKLIARYALRFAAGWFLNKMMTRFYDEARQWDLVWQEIPPGRRDEILLHLISRIQQNLTGNASIPAPVVLSWLHEQRRVHFQTHGKAERPIEVLTQELLKR